ncbi:MAG: endonuclease III [Tenericutes bacterium HGW-Tenericutes-4]|nr:MAG: endonuclease III [Tenericutes bacterium HGW-Tenericutes-4]
MTKQVAKTIFDYLKTIYNNPTSELNFTNTYELLVAVILSAQCTDKRVNLVTPLVFKKYNNVKELANANQDELEECIKSCNYYKTKAKNLIACAKSIENEFNAQVPNNVEDLMKLRGVGKKTANVVYSVGFLGQAIAVDTHVLRVSKRLGLTNSKNPLVVEEDLQNLFSKSVWTELHYMLVLFGRYTCTAKKPNCASCGLKDVCPYYKELQKNKNNKV